MVTIPLKHGPCSPACPRLRAANTSARRASLHPRRVRAKPSPACPPGLSVISISGLPPSPWTWPCRPTVHRGAHAQRSTRVLARHALTYCAFNPDIILWVDAISPLPDTLLRLSARMLAGDRLGGASFN